MKQTCCTVLIHYMALASLPEIARPSSEVVVGCTCIGTHLGVGENWPCERISVRSLHQIVANHPNGSVGRSDCLLVMSLCLGRVAGILGNRGSLEKKRKREENPPDDVFIYNSSICFAETVPRPTTFRNLTI